MELNCRNLEEFKAYVEDYEDSPNFGEPKMNFAWFQGYLVCLANNHIMLWDNFYVCNEWLAKYFSR